MSTAPIQPLPPVMTTDEVAAILRCSVRTVQAYVHSHQLDAIQIGRERVRHAQTAGLLALLPDLRLLCAIQREPHRGQHCPGIARAWERRDQGYVDPWELARV